MEDFGAVSLLASLLGLVIAVAMMLAQFRLFSIDKTMKEILAELQKTGQPSSPPATESEAELARRRAAIADVQTNWPGYK
ncbi:MAG: hypothetical protein ACXV5J_12645 [Candidatus Angelobacter sp.]